MNENLRKAVEALHAGASDVKGISSRSASHIRDSLSRTVDNILSHLEAEQRAEEGDPEAVTSELDRKAKDIAEDLRRVERLMRDRQGRE
jgi:hypothetical protein